VKNIGAHLQEYFQQISRAVNHANKIAIEARKKGFDPENFPEVYIAENAAARVEGLVGPPGIAKRINELSHQLETKEHIAFTIAREIVEEKFGKGSPEELGEQALRTALAILTEGIVAAPIEGISEFKIKKFGDESYVAVYYAGPIRAAGGTAAAVSILLTDYIRRLLKVPAYKATDEEVERMVEEILAYKKKVNLQIPTTEEQIRFAMRHVPIEINGEPTEDVEVVGYRDLPRLETNRLRGGACLVFNDGLVGRAKKLLKRVKMLNLEGWDWLEKLDKIGKMEKKEEENKDEGKNENTKNKSKTKQKKKRSSLEKGIVSVDPSDGYLRDVIGGRPIFAHPTRPGGFRLRYGRARTTGLAGAGIHPATMGVTEGFLATGTHIRTERPGKGSIVTPVDTIEPPIVLLKNGDVVKVESYEDAVEIYPQIERILFIGDMLISVAEYVQNNYKLNPAGYCEEWWALEVKREARKKRKPKYLNKAYIKDPFHNTPQIEEAINISRELGVPLHPKYTPFFDLLNSEDITTYFELTQSLKDNIIPLSEKYKKVLEKSWLPHVVTDKGYIIEEEMAIALKTIFSARPYIEENKTPIEIINEISPLIIRPRAGTFIGGRMGRPEKAADRKMKPPVHGLFPISDVGGQQRDLVKASEIGIYEEEIQLFICPKCGKKTFHRICPTCQIKTDPWYKCPKCNMIVEQERCPACGTKALTYEKTKINILDEINRVKARLGALPPKVKLVKKLMSPTRTSEPLEKAVLRARHNVTIYRDGTIRFDSTDAPMTHFIPQEINTPIEKLRELGYTHDIFGEPLERPDQVLELKVQDIILNEDGAEFLLKVSQFIDDELKELYGLEPFYNATRKKDLIGHLVIGLAPHTSAGIIGRIIGYTPAKVGYAHPYWHAAKRRNCLAPNEKITLWDNVKKEFLEIELGIIVEKAILMEPEIKVVDDYGTIEIINPFKHLFAISINPITKTPIKQEIKAWIKGYSDYWLEIMTKSGEKITMTPDHRLMVWNKDQERYEKKKAFQLKKGDKIPIIQEHSINYESIKIEKQELLLSEKIRNEEIVKIERKIKKQNSYCVEVIPKDGGKDLFHNIILNSSTVTMQCDSDEDAVLLLLDGLINFSKHFLPAKRGSKMDAPLVLVINLDPLEVDDEAHNVDCNWEYPLEVYYASWREEDPSSIEELLDNVKKRLETNLAFEGIGYTHPASKAFDGPPSTLYKRLGKMDEKVDAQLRIAKLIDAVEMNDVAKRVIEKHFLPDIIGNLRKFGAQKFRCTTCNTTYRRIPLSGKCTNKKCKGGKLNLTIHKKSVTKYFDLSFTLAKKYGLSDYLISRLEALKLGFEDDDEEKDNQKTLDLGEYF